MSPGQSILIMAFPSATPPNIYRKKCIILNKAKMNEVEIESQVECNSQTFNITGKNQIENLRKDVKSMILAAKFRVEFYKKFRIAAR